MRARALDWKRRSERLVRLSGVPYTIVRPGWLDNGPAGRHVTIEQGDTGEGSITREVLGTVHIRGQSRMTWLSCERPDQNGPRHAGCTGTEGDHLHGAGWSAGAGQRPG
jgi:hypothetical protein